MRAVFFDLDGTLVDTEGVAMAVTLQWLRDQHLDPSQLREDTVVGRTWASASDTLVRTYRLAQTPAAVEQALIAAFRKKTAEGVVAIPGAADFIRAIALRYRLFVVSGSPRRDIAHALKSLQVEACFEAYFGAEDYPRSKPAPDSYLTALKAAKLTPAEGMVFEDSPAGIAAADAAGLRVVVVTATHRVPAAGLENRRTLHDFRGIDAAWLDAYFAS